MTLTPTAVGVALVLAAVAITALAARWPLIPSLCAGGIFAIGLNLLIR